MLRRLLVKSIFVWLVAISSAVALPQKQAKPDLSGSWLLEVKKSNSSGVTNRPDLTIRISHHDPEFRVMLPSESKGHVVEREFVYFTDGRGETNPATTLLTTNPGATHPRDMGVTESKTKWSGNKIVTRSALRLTMHADVVEFELVNEWKLSADGKSLTHTTATVFKRSSSGLFIPAMAPDKKIVYKRV